MDGRFERKIEKFIGRQKVALIGSIDGDGFPNTKAMLAPRKSEGIKTFYFSTNTSSVHVGQYRANPNACIYFYRKGLIRYEGLLLKGRMEILEDDRIKKALWKTGDNLFYPKGVTDPDYCVLKFVAQEGRYYCDLKSESFIV